MTAQPHNPDVVYPELRLVTYDQTNKVVPVVLVSGDYMPRDILKGGANLAEFLTPLIELMASHIKVRQAGGQWAIQDNHNNHPALSIGKQLLSLCESGRAGYKCMVSDDAKIEGRKYLIIQIDKPEKAA